MKIYSQNFLAKNHSWSYTVQSIARSFIKKKYDYHLFSTNGLEFFPEDLKPHLKGYIDGNKKFGELDESYDLGISYTAPLNFTKYLDRSKIKFGIWTSEFNSDKNPLPAGFAKFCQYPDKILAPSKFSKDIFINSGIQENKIEVIPHGIDVSLFDQATPFKLKTNKSAKIFLNFGQPHLRKNIKDTLEVYGKAFSKKDDVCLVIKGINKIPQQPFEVSYEKLFKEFRFKYSNHAEVEFIDGFIPNIFSLYKVCDIYFSTTWGEGYGYPFLESLLSGLINIAPNYSGYLDFLNENNSFLISGRLAPAPKEALYWDANVNANIFKINIDEAVDKLKFVVKNKDIIKEKLKSNRSIVLEKYSWDKVTDQIIELYNKVK
jgi:glycosyltransferase involved in cell wall biosynthesis